ncbi:MAG TPA: hypothetical protein VJ843_05960 [Candidatus Saccharimonadales bacterium]|nr:hypothetical protein [Candidatus Saccharimonadales bacterium]
MSSIGRRKGFAALGVTLAVVIALVIGVMHFDVLDRFRSHKQEQYTSIGGNVAEAKGGPKLKATPAAVKGAMPFAWAVKPLGNTVHITPDGQLPKPVTLRFTLSKPVTNKQRADVFIAVNETGKAADWTLRKPDKVSDDGKYAYVTTNTLSWWQPVLKATGDLLNAFKTEMRRGLDALTGDATTVSGPATCVGESDAKARGYSLKAQGDSVHYCLGWKDNAPYLAEYNNRRYALQVVHPGMESTYLKRTSLNLSELARSKKYTILSAFDGAEFKLTKMPAGTQATFGGEANALAQLQFGVETLVNIMTRFGAGGGIIKNGAITMTNADRVAEVTSKFLAVKGCGAQLFNVQDVSFGSLLQNCFDADTLGQVFGWRGVFLGAIMVVGPLVEFFRGQFNALGDMLNGRDKTTILVTYDPYAKYVAETWTRHESQFKVHKDHTAEMLIGYGAGGADGCGPWCTFRANLKVTANKDGSLTGTYTKVWFQAAVIPDDGKLHDVPTPPANVTDAFPHVGDTTTITALSHDRLNISNFRGSGSSWCGPNVPLGKWQSPCGA